MQPALDRLQPRILILQKLREKEKRWRFSFQIKFRNVVTNLAIWLLGDTSSQPDSLIIVRSHSEIIQFYCCGHWGRGRSGGACTASPAFTNDFWWARMQAVCLCVWMLIVSSEFLFFFLVHLPKTNNDYHLDTKKSCREVERSINIHFRGETLDWKEQEEKTVFQHCQKLPCSTTAPAQAIRSSIPARHHAGPAPGYGVLLAG